MKDILSYLDRIGKEYENGINNVTELYIKHQASGERTIEEGGTIVKVKTTLDFNPAIKKIIEDTETRISVIVRDFAKDVEASYYANPNDLDEKSVELLKYVLKDDKIEPAKKRRFPFTEQDAYRIGMKYRYTNPTMYRMYSNAFPLLLPKLPDPALIVDDLDDYARRALKPRFEDLITKRNETWEKWKEFFPQMAIHFALCMIRERSVYPTEEGLKLLDEWIKQIGDKADSEVNKLRQELTAEAEREAKRSGVIYPKAFVFSREPQAPMIMGT